MDSFMRVAAWTTSPALSQSPSAAETSSPEAKKSPPSRPFGHFRSLSSITGSPTPNRPARIPGKSPSTSQLPHVPLPYSATSSPSLRPSPSMQSPDEDAELSTLPDPRSRAMSPANEGDPPVGSPPDLQDEVTALSTKLINAINHQTALGDTLSGTRQELEQARERIRQLEVTNESQREMLGGHVWVRRQTVEHEKKELLQKVADEKRARLEVEKEKRKIEGELEALTALLFEEANKMVSAANEEAQKKQDMMEKKNEQLKAQISDTEALLRSHQEQLAELKQVMEHLTADRDDQTNLTAPSSPGLSKFDSRDDERPLPYGHLASPLTEPVSPAYPTSFAHLIQPVLRTDLASYEDFKLLARAGRNRAGSRVSTGSMSGVTVVGTGLAGGANSSAHPSNASAASLATTATSATGSPQTPHTPGSNLGSPTSASRGEGPALKDTKFYKRVLVEDIEPTLRLDTAPGLGKWLGRRNVLTAMADGSLVVEPAPKAAQHSACSLCGELRTDVAHLRTHGFRTSESESAQRYPLCGYCLARLRSTCDFLGFLRILKDGHWRTDDADSEKAAWEESVRLREQMFWARIGGGVVPAGHPIMADGESPRRSREEPVGPVHPVQTAVETHIKTQSQSPHDHDPPSIEPSDVAAPVTPPRSVRNSAQSLEINVEGTPGSDKESKRLSITIPSEAN